VGINTKRFDIQYLGNRFVLGVQSHNRKSPLMKTKGKRKTIFFFIIWYVINDPLKKTVQNKRDVKWVAIWRIINTYDEEEEQASKKLMLIRCRGERCGCFSLSLLSGFLILFKTLECGGVEFGHLVQLGFQNGILKRTTGKIKTYTIAETRKSELNLGRTF
jgi:hypothetical protein